MHINNKIDDKINDIKNLLSHIKSNDDITVPTLLMCEIFDNFIGEKTDYRALRNKIRDLHLPHLYSEDLTKITQPVINEIKNLNSLLKSTNGIDDKEILNFFSVLAKTIEGCQIINEEIRREELYKVHQHKLESELGKINTIDIQIDGPFMGLMMNFSINGGSGGVTLQSKQWHNIDSRKTHNEHCKWSPAASISYSSDCMDFLNKLMKEAKVSKMSQLVNKPVELYFNNNTLHSFRILTEVL